MSKTITIKIRNKKARTILKGLEELKVIEIVEEDITRNWSPKKKQQAKDFLSAYKEAKLAEQGKIKLKTAQSLIDEL
jgi:hypothetical protein